MFYFKLHPSQWQSDSDRKVVFRALELADGTYMVSWKTQYSHETIDVIFEQEEVTQAMALGHWIITDENGEK
jgi:hypothetical protein